MNKAVHIYGLGLCVASVCAPAEMSPEEVAAAVSIVEPTGLDHGWTPSADATFRTGQPNPSTCDMDESRKHHLLEC